MHRLCDPQRRVAQTDVVLRETHRELLQRYHNEVLIELLELRPVTQILTSLAILLKFALPLKLRPLLDPPSIINSMRPPPEFQFLLLTY